MAVNEMIDLVAWLKAQKSLIRNYHNDIDIDIDTLRNDYASVGCHCWGLVRENGSELGRLDRVFYNWSEKYFYFKLTIRKVTPKHIYGDVSIYSVNFASYLNDEPDRAFIREMESKHRGG